MKNIFKYVALFAFVLNLQAQDFQGEAIYKSHRKMNFKMDGVEEGIEMEKQIQAQLTKQFQKEYTLSFNKTESFYRVNTSLAKPSPQNSMITIEVSGDKETLYKNIKENRFASQTEIFGKQFLVQDAIKPIAWELVDETKFIGIYECRKAIFKETYTEDVFNEFGQFEAKTKELTTTAWYTMQIPISNGPLDFGG